MSTGTAIIQDALKTIGAHSVATPAAPEDILDGMRRLNSMAELWLTKGIKIGTTPLQDPGSQLNELGDMRNVIVDNLAVLLQPNFPNLPMPPQLVLNAATGFNAAMNLYMEIDIPAKVLSSTTPIGEGNRRGVNSLNYFPKGTALDG